MIKLALGEENARKTPISSTKGATGHCLGAAGAVEAIFSTLAAQRGRAAADDQLRRRRIRTCDLDYIPNEARKADIEIGVSNSFGFGGHNACIVLRRWERLGPLASEATHRPKAGHRSVDDGASAAPFALGAEERRRTTVRRRAGSEPPRPELRLEACAELGSDRSRGRSGPTA